MLGNSLIQCNGVHSNVCGNTLDLLFVNDESKVDQVAAMDVDFTTYHTVLNFNILLKMSEKPNVSRKVFNYKKADVAKLCALLSALILILLRMLQILMQLGTHGSSIKINLLVNVSHKLVSGNLMRLCGSTPKLDICRLKKKISGK